MATAIDSTLSKRDSRVLSLGASSRHNAPFNVSTRDAAAIEYWCRHFNTSPDRLLAAVRKVGSNPDIIRLELRSR
jgi:hypothetical protein